MPCSHNTSTLQGTHIGRVRRTNEDALFVNEREGLWLVADGIGGHGNGERASATVSSMLRVTVRATPSSCAGTTLRRGFYRRMKACGNIPGSGASGTTVAALLFCQSKALFVWAGDSRIYRMRGGELVLVTEDHNLAHERHRRGELSLDEAQRLPSANVLTKASGISKHLRLQTHIDEVEAGDRYLISTDGLYKEFTFESLQHRLSGQFDDQILQALIDEALNQGGKDNITGVVVDVGE